MVISNTLAVTDLLFPFVKCNTTGAFNKINTVPRKDNNHLKLPKEERNTSNKMEKHIFNRHT